MSREGVPALCGVLCFLSVNPMVSDKEVKTSKVFLNGYNGRKNNDLADL